MPLITKHTANTISNLMLDIVENIFSNDLLKKLINFTRDGKQPTHTNFFNWTENVIGISNAIFTFDLTEELKKEVTEELIKKNVIKKEPKDWSVNIQLFSRCSFIPWHNDQKYIFSGAIYLNNNWNNDLGGYFMYEENNEIKAIVPKFNMGAFFKPPMQHQVSLTSLNAPMRESLQIFVKEF